MKKGIIITIVVVALIAMVAGSFAMKGKKGLQVDTVEVITGDITSSIRGEGEVQPKSKVEVSSQVVGEIKHIDFREGEKVKAGDRLVALDREFFDADIERLEASLRQADVGVDGSRINLKDTQTDLQRTEALISQGLASNQQLQKAKLAVESARIGVRQSQETRAQTKASLTKAKDQVKKTTIFASMDGVITLVNAEEGETAITGTMNNPGTVLLVVSDLSEILVELVVDETEIVKLDVGQPAEILVDAMDDITFLGKVTEIGQSALQNPGESVKVFKVKVALADPSPKLRPGMSARVTIITKKTQNVMKIPIQAVQERETKAYKERKKRVKAMGKTVKPEPNDFKKIVFLLEKGKAVEVEVETGVSDDLEVAILKGLTVNQKVIVGPYRVVKDLRDGLRVTERNKKSKFKKSEDKDES